MGCQGTRILAHNILCILKLQTDIFLFVPVLCQDIAYISYMKKESLNKEKPCNVILNIYIYFLYIFIYIAVTI